jgi:formylglycine-generating enzyme required for sulfatase activity
MKTFRQLNLYPLLLAALLVSCAGEEMSVSGYGAGTDGEARTPVAFSAQTGSPETRTSASGSQWLTTDGVGIFMHTSGQTLSDASISEEAANRLYRPQTAAASSALNPATVAEAIYFPQSGQVDFTAYYPWKAGAGQINNYVYPVDLSDQSDPAALDLLYARQTGRDKNSASVTLDFAHQLSKITLHVKKGADIGTVDFSAATATLSGMPATGSFDLASGSISPGAVADFQALKVAASTGFDAGFEALLLPQAAGAGRKAVFAAGTETYEWAIPEDLVFEAGRNYIYALSAHAGGSVKTEETATAPIGSITPWENDDHSASGLIETVRIPAGTFEMGIPETEPEDFYHYSKNQLTVTLTEDFYMSKYEITNAQYAAFLNVKGIEGVYDGGSVRKAIYETNALFYQTNDRGVYWDEEAGQWIVRDASYRNHPVIDVTWYGADEFARWAGGSLPTEAQWEYACRAGTDTPFGVGEGTSLYADQANFNGGYPYAGGSISNYLGYEPPHTYLDRTAPVGSYPPNAWGLYDMHGNATEWCNDWFDYPYDNSPVDPAGPATGYGRVVRGGGYSNYAVECRSASRMGYTPGSYSGSSSSSSSLILGYNYNYNHSSSFGFRVVFTASE